MSDLMLAERGLDRRRFLGGAGAAAGAGLVSSLAGGRMALARGGDHDGGRDLRLLPVPEPIPGGLPVGLDPPYDFVHIFLPGPTDVTLPFSGLQLMGLDVEPSTITNFNGTTALAYIVGTATGSDGVEYGLEVDIRAFEGSYVAGSSAPTRGTFAMI